MKLNQVIVRDTRSNQPSASIEGRLYYVTDENVLERDSGSDWENIEAYIPPGEKMFSVEDVVEVSTGAMRIGNHSGSSRTITGVYLHIDTAPTGAALIVDVNVNGTTIFTTQSNRPQIAAGAYSGNSTTIEAATWANGEYITADVDQIGSTIAGSNLTIMVLYQ